MRLHNEKILKFAPETKHQMPDEWTEQRKFKRFNTQMKVFTQETDELLGYAKNLNLEGLKLKSIEPIVDDGKVIQIWSRASKDGDNEKRILLSARKRWGTFPYTVPRIFNSGLYFINLSEEASDSIENLTLELSE